MSISLVTEEAKVTSPPGLFEEEGQSVLQNFSETDYEFLKQSNASSRTNSTTVLNPLNASISESTLISIQDISPKEVDSLAIFQGLEDKAGMDELFQHFRIWEAMWKNENHAVWEHRCRAVMPTSALESDSMASIPTYRGKLLAFLGAWNPSMKHSSPSIYLKEDSLTAHRIPGFRKSDAIRGKLGFNRGVHAWDIQFKGRLGTHCCVGVATEEARLRCKGYKALVGCDNHSFGWNLVSGDICHKGVSFGKFPEADSEYSDFKYDTGMTLRMILDCERNFVSFWVDGDVLGVGFDELPSRTFFPSVSMVAGHTEALMIYRGSPNPEIN